jgi:arylsulfatase
MLTGVDYHRAGLGGNVEVAADNQKGLPAYQGFLRDDVVAVSELLRDAGYHTYMAGKWHLGKDPRNLPGGRGFERSFALLRPSKSCSTAHPMSSWSRASVIGAAAHASSSARGTHSSARV